MRKVEPAPLGVPSSLIHLPLSPVGWLVPPAASPGAFLDWLILYWHVVGLCVRSTTSKAKHRWLREEAGCAFSHRLDQILSRNIWFLVLDLISFYYGCPYKMNEWMNLYWHLVGKTSKFFTCGFKKLVDQAPKLYPLRSYVFRRSGKGCKKLK